MHNFSNLFDKVLYTFPSSPLSSSGVSQHCIHAIGICHASSVGPDLASRHPTELASQYLLRVYSVEILLMMTVDLTETCRALYQINLRNSVSRWLLL